MKESCMIRLETYGEVGGYKRDRNGVREIRGPYRGVD